MWHLFLLVFIFTQNDSSQSPTSASDISSGMDEKSISSLYNQVNYSLNIKRSALVHSNCPSHLSERVCVCVWAGLLQHLYIVTALPICLSMCVCGLDSSNPCALSAKDVLILFPSIEQGGWVLIRRSMSANKKTCRPEFAIGCAWCHKAHCPVTFGFF